MISFILILLLPILFGILAVSRLPLAETWLIRFSIGIPFGISTFTFLVVMLYAVSGQITAMSVYAALFVCFAASAYIHERCSTGAAPHKQKTHTEIANIPRPLLLLIILLFISISGIFITAANNIGGSIYCNVNAFCSDLISHIAYGNAPLNHTFPPPYTMATGIIDVFPFIYDLYTMLLAEYGLGLLNSIMTTDVLMVFSFTSLSVLLAYRVSKSTFTTSAAALMFWFGTNFVVALPFYIFSDALARFYPWIVIFLPKLAYIAQISGFLVVNQSSINEAALLSQLLIGSWVPPLNAMLLPQRSFMLGLALGLSIMYVLYDMLFRSKKPILLEFALLGAMVGMLPMVQPPILLAIAIIGVFATIHVLLHKEWRAWLTGLAAFISVLLALALPQIAYLSRQPLPAGWFHFVYQTFVLTNGSNVFVTALFALIAFLMYWLEFLGLVFPLAIVGIYASKRSGGSLLPLAVPFFAILGAISLYSIRLNGSDMNNVLLFSLLPFSIFAGYALHSVYAKGGTYKAIAIIFILLICGNYVAVYSGTFAQGGYTLVSPAEINATNFILNTTPANAMFAVNDFYTLYSIVPSLASRRTVLSIAAYAADASGSTSALANATDIIFRTGSCSAMARYNVSYLYFTSNPSAPNAPGVNATAVASDVVLDTSPNLTLVYRANDTKLNDFIKIYKVRC